MRFLAAVLVFLSTSLPASACDCYTVYNTAHRILNSPDDYGVTPEDLTLALYERDVIDSFEIREARLAIATRVGTATPDVAILPHPAEKLAELVDLCKKM